MAIVTISFDGVQWGSLERRRDVRAMNSICDEFCPQVASRVRWGNKTVMIVRRSMIDSEMVMQQPVEGCCESPVVVWLTRSLH